MPGSSPIADEFLAALEQQGGEIDRLAGDAWQGGVVCCRVAGLGVVMVTATDMSPGQWSLAATDVQRVQQLAGERHEPCWFVFLIVRRDGRGANGYVVTDFDSPPVKRPFELNDDGYHIREKRNFDSLRLLLSTEKVADVLLRNKQA